MTDRVNTTFVRFMILKHDNYLALLVPECKFNQNIKNSKRK